jgi:hypothetical protein
MGRDLVGVIDDVLDPGFHLHQVYYARGGCSSFQGSNSRIMQ